MDTDILFGEILKRIQLIQIAIEQVFDHGPVY